MCAAILNVAFCVEMCSSLFDHYASKFSEMVSLVWAAGLIMGVLFLTPEMDSDGRIKPSLISLAKLVNVRHFAE